MSAADPLADLPDDAPLPDIWTPDHVALRLIEAFRTLDRLPRVRGPKEPGGHWPRHRVEWADRLAEAELPEDERQARAAWRNRVGLKPTSRDLDRMDTALDWLRDLRSVDPGMALLTTLWALRAARRRSVRALCREKGWAPHTVYRLRAKPLDLLAARLNARRVPVS